METVVIKVGGSVADDCEGLLSQIAERASGAEGTKIIIVHGGASKVTSVAQKMGVGQKFVLSKEGFKSRFTDRETMRVFVMVTCGLINKSLVESLSKKGAKAFGLCGADGGLVRAKRKDVLVAFEDGKEKILRGDYSGKITSVDKGMLEGLLNAGMLPIIAPVALSAENELVSLDADRLAAAVAKAIGAKRLLFFTDVDGFFWNFPDGFAARIDGAAQIEEAIKAASAGMKKKILAAREALSGPITEVIIANARADGPLDNSLFGDRRTAITL
jgi:acetylglutamate/LysW-gamma-L-alpha-aminoadipate kinase